MKKLTMMAVLFSASIMGFSQITHNLVLDMDFQSGVVDSSSQNQAATAMGTVLYGSDQWNMANSCLQLAGGSNPDGIEIYWDNWSIQSFLSCYYFCMGKIKCI
jgi:hypothetical protein